MTHCFFSQGLSAFFEQPPDRLVGDVRNDFQFDHAVGQQLHRPPQPSFRRLRARQGDDERLLLGRQLGCRARSGALGQGHFEPLLDEALARACHCGQAAMQRRCDLRVAPPLVG
jgi:hypothetical protein